MAKNRLIPILQLELAHALFLGTLNELDGVG